MDENLHWQKVYSFSIIGLILCLLVSLAIFDALRSSRKDTEFFEKRRQR